MIKDCTRLCIARLPWNAWRVQAYRWLGYDVASTAVIGYKTVIFSNACIVEKGVHIGGHCSIGCGQFQAGPDTRILSGNSFVGGGKTLLGKNVRIGNNHYFDCSYNLTIGDNTWIAGRGSQFWTHGTTKDVTDRSITIGNNVYVSAGCLFAPGAAIADGCLVLLGSVVTSRFERPNCLIGGNPARLLMSDYQWSEKWA